MIDRCLLGICSRLLYILFAAFPSLVNGPSVCHSLLVKVEQTITSNPIENPAYSVEYNNYFPRVKVDDHLLWLHSMSILLRRSITSFLNQDWTKHWFTFTLLMRHRWRWIHSINIHGIGVNWAGWATIFRHIASRCVWTKKRTLLQRTIHMSKQVKWMQSQDGLHDRPCITLWHASIPVAKSTIAPSWMIPY